MKNKKGAEMTIGTLVVIALAILVLATLTFGFWSGWSNLWSRISPSKVNVDSVRSSCQTACITQQQYEFCCLQRDIVVQEGGEKIKGTCYNQRNTYLKGDCTMSCGNYIDTACSTVPKEPQAASQPANQNSSTQNSSAQ